MATHTCICRVAVIVLLRCLVHVSLSQEIRKVMEEYWDEHSKNGTIQEMMLDIDAEDLSKDELPEILSCLPPVDDMEIVELGAGIGRFTSHVAEKARRVLAVDFMESFIKKNKQLNAKYGNIDYLVADVVDLSLNPNDWDLVFSNWLYMYLDIAELTDLIRNMLAWLRPNGYMFCRESCNHQSGNKPRSSNPTYYRDVFVYDALFSSVTIPTEDGKAFYGFDIVVSRPVDTYLKQKQNENQVTWLVQKVRRDVDTSFRFSPTKPIQDYQEIAIRDVIHMESIVGRGFMTAGGLDVAKASVSKLDIKKDQTVLDIGCGIGGFAIHVAKETGAKVLASDTSTTSVRMGRDRAQEEGVSSMVDFEVSDITKRIFSSESFDVIHVGDPLSSYTSDTSSILQKLLVILKSQGKVLVARTSPSSEQDIERMAEAGFTNIRAVPMKDIFIQALEKEIQTMQIFPDDECVGILNIKQEDLRLLRQGESTSGFIYAEKQ